jgi:hypothetical protein
MYAVGARVATFSGALRPGRAYIEVMPPTSRRRDILYRQKIKAYRWLYEFTKSRCHDCAGTDCACKDSICAHVQAQARASGVELRATGHERLRFIGCSGCVVEPHLRETCTIYLCQPALGAADFPHERYERLKNLCAKIDWKLMATSEGV